MKKIFFILSFFCIAAAAQAQPGSLDTSKATVTLKCGDILYLASYLNGKTDSVSIEFMRNLRNKLRSIPNLTIGTQVQLLNVPGNYLVDWYSLAMRIPLGEGQNLAAATFSTLRTISHPVISYFIGAIDSGGSGEFIRHQNLGKNLFIDGNQ